MNTLHNSTNNMTFILNAKWTLFTERVLFYSNVMYLYMYHKVFFQYCKLKVLCGGGLVKDIYSLFSVYIRYI